jgi:hypothetical protein
MGLHSLGQFYCTPCGRHFIDAKTRDVHLATKVHKRRYVCSASSLGPSLAPKVSNPLLPCRMKDVAQKQYSQKEADAGAGRTVEKYVPIRAKDTEMEDL